MKNTQNTPKKEFITLEGLKALLSGLLTATPATILAITEAKMNKKGNPYLGTLKVQESNVWINFSYANAVNKQLKKQGDAADFVPAARKWGQHIANTPLVHHINKEGVEKFYLETRFLNASKPTYIFQGSPIAKETIEQYLVKPSSNAAHQGLVEENEVIIRDFELSGIRSIKVLGNHYEII